MHLAPTASRRVYQQRVGRVTRRNPGKEAGLVDRLRPPGDHPRRDDRHPAQPARPRRLPRRRDRRRPGAPRPRPPGAGREAGRPGLGRSRAAPAGARARALADRGREPGPLRAARLGGARRRAGQPRRLAPRQGDAPARPTKELRRRFLLTCVQRNRNQQLRLKALAEIAALRDAEAFDDAIDIGRHLVRATSAAPAPRSCCEALAERRIGRRDQAQAWVWRLADYTRDLHEEYAVQRWPETKRLLGLLVNSSGRAHGRNARRLVHAARNQDRRLAAALLAAGGRPHARGRGGAARGADARGAQALGGRPRAAPQLPEGRAAPRRRKRKRRLAGRAAPRRTATAAEARPKREPRTSDELERARGRRARTARPEPDEASSRPRRRPKLRLERSTARWTSPAPSVTRSPSSSSTTRWPRSSISVGRRPRRRSQEIRRPPARRAPGRRQHLVVARPRASGRATRRARRAARTLGAPPAAGRPRPRRAAARWPSRGAPAGSPRRPIATLSPTPITAQPSSGRASTRTPATLRSSIQTSLGHLTRQRTGATASAASQTASGTASGSSGASPGDGPQQRGVEEGGSRRREPGGAPAAAPRGLLFGRHHEPAGGARERELPGPLVGRVGAPEVAVRGARAATHSQRASVTSRSGRRSISPAALPPLTASASAPEESSKSSTRPGRRRRRCRAQTASQRPSGARTSRASPGRRRPVGEHRGIEVEGDVAVAVHVDRVGDDLAVGDPGVGRSSATSEPGRSTRRPPRGARPATGARRPGRTGRARGRWPRRAQAEGRAGELDRLERAAEAVERAGEQPVVRADQEAVPRRPRRRPPGAPSRHRGRPPPGARPAGRRAARWRGPRRPARMSWRAIPWVRSIDARRGRSARSPPGRRPRTRPRSRSRRGR